MNQDVKKDKLIELSVIIHKNNLYRSSTEDTIPVNEQRRTKQLRTNILNLRTYRSYDKINLYFNIIFLSPINID